MVRLLRNRGFLSRLVGVRNWGEEPGKKGEEPGVSGVDREERVAPGRGEDRGGRGNEWRRRAGRRDVIH